ncbi:MAG: acetyl-CoA carboxylase biotin carboxyl carrier protein subunit [Gemmatimonadota bacterium]
MLYFVTVGGRTMEVDLTGGIAKVDGEIIDAELTTVPGTDVRSLRIGADSHALLARPGAARGLWNITIGGRTLPVEAIDERTRTIREMAREAEAEAVKVVAAPMPGLVVRINVEVGDVVSAGQGVVVIEAMKMENELKAPADGTVSRIEVTAGAAVEKGAILVTLE